MFNLAKDLEFERAALIRDEIRNIEEMFEPDKK
jgi:protein-arginine kinase activator protein McsA